MIFGPTAVGKTDLLLSEVFSNSEIINADSMQVYRRMDIGTAKPDPEFLQKVKHHLINILEPSEQFNAGDFVTSADGLAAEITDRGKLPVICGGTGFYFRNFIYGLPEAPPSDGNVRERLQREMEKDGPAVLHNRLEQADPASARRINVNDRYRTVRALEVFEVSGRPLSSYTLPQHPRERYDIYLIGLTRPRKELYRRINERVGIMMEQGLEDEFRRLIASGCTADDPGMRGIGYREFFTMEEQGLSIEDTAELIRRNSRRYAKRQITFFRQLEPINWFEPEDLKGITGGITDFLKR